MNETNNILVTWIIDIPRLGTSVDENDMINYASLCHDGVTVKRLPYEKNIGQPSQYRGVRKTVNEHCIHFV
jgi:hypothetical protein